MSALAATFERLRAERRGGLVGYVTAGDPDLDTSRRVLGALVRGGVDVIEVGVPFSDPIADGPVIQRASERALASGSHLPAALALVRAVREPLEAPVVLFTYVNPVLCLGLERFAEEAQAAGVDGVLLLDLPVEEAAPARAVLDRHGIDQIFLVSPTTTDRRLREAARLGRGFLYAISRLGVTGARDQIASSARPLVDRLRAVTDLPIAMGFGLARPAQVAEVQQYADAAVVGSAIVQEIERAARTGEDVPGAVESFVRRLTSREGVSPRGRG